MTRPSRRELERELGDLSDGVDDTLEIDEVRVVRPTEDGYVDIKTGEFVEEPGEIAADLTGGGGDEHRAPGDVTGDRGHHG